MLQNECCKIYSKIGYTGIEHITYFTSNKNDELLQYKDYKYHMWTKVRSIRRY